MPLQNRVDPFGAIHAVAQRGLFTGNRGVIHDAETRKLLARRWTTRAWLICDCGFRGRKREVMGRNAPSGGAGWTNLFFLDEPTALAAGHRPCFTCRREKALEFADCFGKALGMAPPKASEIDGCLHRQRCAAGASPFQLSTAAMDGLPDGAMIEQGGHCLARHSGTFLAWGFGGYAEARDDARDAPPRLLTPPSTVATLRAGYVPVWHPSALRPAAP